MIAVGLVEDLICLRHCCLRRELQTHQLFDPFFGATAPPLLPSLPRTEPSVPPYPNDLPPPPDYNSLFAERIAIADTDPNLCTDSRHRPTIRIIPRVREAEPTAPELLPEEQEQIRLSPTVWGVFPKQEIGIDQDSSEFLDCLQDEIWENLMQRNKITIHVETGNIYYDNINTAEIIYTFFAAQQDQTKKLMSE